MPRNSSSRAVTRRMYASCKAADVDARSSDDAGNDSAALQDAYILRVTALEELFRGTVESLPENLP